MPFITINQQKLFYTDHNAHSTGPTLLLIHGAGGTHLDWSPQLRRLPHTAVYTLDLPGHGRSAPPSATSITGYADTIMAFINQLERKQLFLAGHSMGGAIVQNIGLNPPSAVAGLILVGSGARLRVADAILNQILNDFDSALDTIIQYAWSPETPPEMVALGRQMLAKNTPQLLYRDYTACNQFDMIGQLDQIHLPTLVISGTADRLTPPKYGRYLAEHIPQATLTTITNGSHMMALEKADAVAAAVTTFIHPSQP